MSEEDQLELEISPPLIAGGKIYTTLVSSVIKHIVEVSGENFHLAQSLAMMAAQRFKSENDYSYRMGRIEMDREEAEKKK